MTLGEKERSQEIYIPQQSQQNKGKILVSCRRRPPNFFCRFLAPLSYHRPGRFVIISLPCTKFSQLLASLPHFFLIICLPGAPWNLSTIWPAKLVILFLLLATANNKVASISDKNSHQTLDPDKWAEPADVRWLSSCPNVSDAKMLPPRHSSSFPEKLLAF